MAGRKAQTVLEQRLSRRARAAVPQLRVRAAERIELQKGAMVRELKGVAMALRSAAEQLEKRDQMMVAGYAQRAADAAERAGDALDRKSLSEIGSDIERLCRERPMLVGAAVVAGGYMAARFIRSAAAGTAVSSRPSVVSSRRAAARSA